MCGQLWSVDTESASEQSEMENQEGIFQLGKERRQKGKKREREERGKFGEKGKKVGESKVERQNGERDRMRNKGHQESRRKSKRRKNRETHPEPENSMLTGDLIKTCLETSHPRNNMNTILACQDQYFAGGQGCDFPYPSSTSEANVDVSKETWVSLWASGLLDNRSSNQNPQTHEQLYNVGYTLQDEYLFGNQLSSQIFTNKQLQDTLQQKEEELARLHEENNKLKQYLNSTFVKCLEEKTKKLLSQNVQSSFCTPQKRKSRLSSPSLMEAPCKKAKRNLIDAFTACEGQAGVDTWVLQTLGLKDVNTIDDSSSANYSATPCDMQGPDYSNVQDSPSSGYSSIHMTPAHSQAASSCSQDSTYMHNYSPSQCSSVSVPRSEPVSPFASPIYYTPDVSPNKTEVAFSTSLKPHCNLKTHSFSQGQAFVRRDVQGGWKFTWVPKQSE
ncbi:geminin coiled-coil domain-containing protein 1 [Rhinophrynus dorsalis]